MSPNKKQRLTQLAIDCSVPVKGLRRVINRLALENVALEDVALDERQVERTLQAAHGHLLTTITLSTTKGEFAWEVGEPSAVLKDYLESPALRPYVRSMLGQRGCDPRHPLRLVFYCDEVTPGNALKLDNKRKTNAYYATLVELPPVLRAHRENWFPMAFLRSTVAKVAVGGWTAIASEILALAFVGPKSIADAGIVINIDFPRTVFFEFFALIGDSPALSTFMGAKGCNGIVPCPFMCSNLTSITSDVAAYDDEGILVNSACSDRTKIIRATNEQVWEKFDLLEERRPTVTKTKLEDMEKAAGLNCVPNGVLANRQLRRYLQPAEMIAVDPMHVLVSNGVVNFELYWLFKQCGWNWCYDSMRTLAAADWRLPKRFQSNIIQRPFDPSHQKASDHKTHCFKCQAGELLSIMPLVRYSDVGRREPPLLEICLTCFSNWKQLFGRFLLS